MLLFPDGAFRRAAALVATLAVLAAAFSSPSEAATRKKRRLQKKAAPIPEVPRPYDPFEITFPSSDGVRLVATWRPSPTGVSAPAVLLLHAFSRERREMSGLADDLAALGFSTLALDLRGHGESVRKGGARVGASPSLQTSPSGFPRDVEAACAWLRPHASHVAVLGLSLSGNLAALATASGWAEAGVAVSPNIEHFEKLVGTRPRAPQGLLVLVSEKDPGRVASARAFEASGRDPKSTVVYPGALHGITLLQREPAARAAAFKWLGARLGPVVPPPSPVATIPVPEPALTPAAAPTPGGLL